MVPKAIKKVINEYKKSVLQVFPMSSFFVFGSYATGAFGENSDLDMLVVTDEFKNIQGYDRMARLSRLRFGVTAKMPMDIVGLTKSEFAELKKQKNLNLKSVVLNLKKV